MNTTVFAARCSLVCTAATLVVLAALHVLSPEFNPAVRMISEYANGGYAWVLALMFLLSGISTWSLAVALAPRLRTPGGRVALVLLFASGLGATMASVFDINHPLHDVAGLGILALPPAALLISGRLPRTSAALRISAHFTWISLVLFAVAMIVMIVGYTRAGNQLTPEVVALAGYGNRLFEVADCVWQLVVAAHLLALRAPLGSESSHSVTEFVHA